MIILIIGQSGSGKTRSCKNIKDAAIFQCLPKRLPYKKHDSVVLRPTESLDAIEEALRYALSTSPRSLFVIDDFQFPILKKLILESKKDGFKCYLDTADNVIKLLEIAEKSDKRFYFLMNEEKNEGGDITPLTAGKLMKEKFPIEGFFTIVLRCAKCQDSHFFETRSSNSVVKAPEGLFNDDRIDNDIEMVYAAICEFYGIKNNEKKIININRSVSNAVPAFDQAENIQRGFYIKEFEPEINS